MNVRIVCATVTLALSASAAVFAGCGGSNSVDLLSGQDGGTGTDGSAAGDDAAASDAGGGGTDSGGGADVAVDAPPASADGGAPSDAGPGGSTSVVTCGATTCSIPANECCVTQNQNPPPKFAYACTAAGTCGSGAGGGDTTALQCSAAVNCPQGTVCCVSQTGNAVASSCQVACTNQQAQLCDPSLADAGTSGCAADAGTCSNNNIGDWGLPRTFGTCGGKGN